MDMMCILDDTWFFAVHLRVYDRLAKVENENDPIALDHMTIHLATASNAAV